MHRKIMLINTKYCSKLADIAEYLAKKHDVQAYNKDNKRLYSYIKKIKAENPDIVCVYVTGNIINLLLTAPFVESNFVLYIDENIKNTCNTNAKLRQLRLLMHLVTAVIYQNDSVKLFVNKKNSKRDIIIDNGKESDQYLRLERYILSKSVEPKYKVFAQIYRYIVLRFLKYFTAVIPDKLFLQMLFRARMHKKLNLKNPVAFSEKLQYLKLYNKNPIHTKFADKYEVRKIISETIGDEYLIPLIGVYNTTDEIDFDTLPNQFVLKCNHDSGGVVICENKDNLDKQQALSKLNMHLSRNYFYSSREWCYKNIKPRIICEQFMHDNESSELKDYKLMCFNGKVKCSFVCLNRFSDTGLNVDFYDREWNLMPFERKYAQSDTLTPQPVNYDKMIELAEKISRNHPFMRVDFYEINKKIYFGEITLYPGSGAEYFDPAEYDKLLGDWIHLPDKR